MQVSFCKWFRKSKPPYPSRSVKPNMTLQAPGIAVNNLEPLQEMSIPIPLLEN